MKESPFLTIGIASYNYSQYLETAFEAIKKQKFTDYEILYCDDGSTDNSVDIIHKLINDNPAIRIRLIQGENLGVMGNKNRILENAQGKYLMLCDADDKMLNNCLETLCELALETNADQIVGAFERTDEDGKRIECQEMPPNLSRWIWGAHHATLYKMEIIKKNCLRFALNCYPDDMYFNMIFHDHSKTQAYTPKVVYDWRIHTGSASSLKNNDGKWCGIAVLESSLSYISPIAQKYSGNEYMQIEYAAIKMYCLANLYRYSGKLGYFLKSYKEMHSLMEKHFKNYRKNYYAKALSAKGIIRKPTAAVIWLFILAEKTRTIYALLVPYWILTKFKNITI